MAQYKRWYDHDPLLMEVINLLRDYQEDLKTQAMIFLEKIESQVSKEALDSFYAMIKPFEGNRWYDQDPVLSKTIELLRIIPPEIQRKAAYNFLEALKAQGVDPEYLEEKEI